MGIEKLFAVRKKWDGFVSEWNDSVVSGPFYSIQFLRKWKREVRLVV